MVAPADLLLPKGELNADWFSGDLNAVLTAAISESAARGDSDDAVTAFSYHRAYSAIHQDMMSQPATQRDRDKTDTYLAEQLNWWAQRAHWWHCRHEELTNTIPKRAFAPGAAR